MRLIIEPLPKLKIKKKKNYLYYSISIDYLIYNSHLKYTNTTNQTQVPMEKSNQVRLVKSNLPSLILLIFNYLKIYNTI